MYEPDTSTDSGSKDLYPHYYSMVNGDHEYKRLDSSKLHLHMNMTAGEYPRVVVVCAFLFSSSLRKSMIPMIGVMPVTHLVRRVCQYEKRVIFLRGSTFIMCF